MCPTLSRVAFVIPLLLTACPTEPATTGDETTGQAETAPDDTTQDVVVTTGNCSVGMEGCSCTGGGACDPGLSCNAAHVCEQASDETTTESQTSVEPMTGPSVETTAEPQTTTTVGDTTDTDSVGPECTPQADGKESVECVAIDPTRPFCEGSMCVGCVGLADDACQVATEGERPICHPDGRCVQCDAPDALAKGQCTPEQPHCNLDTLACEGCLEHSECPESACQIAERVCFPEENIVYVRKYSAGKDCSEQPGKGGYLTLPYCELGVAVAASQTPHSAYTLYVLANNAASDDHGSLFIEPPQFPVSYAIVHEPGTLLDSHTRLRGPGPLLVVPDKVTVYLKDFGIKIFGGVPSDADIGVYCQEGGSVWLEDSRVLGARGAGIRSENCDIHLNRSAVALGATEGIDMTGGSLFAVNSFISENSNKMLYGGGGLRLDGGATADLLFTTIANNSNVAGSMRGDSIQCDGPASVKVRNSLLARKPTGNNPSVNCTLGTLNVSYTLHDGNLDGVTNAKLAAETIIDALSLDDLTGAFRVLSVRVQGEVFNKIAVWKTGDPHFDYDGTPRAGVDGAEDIVGGDRFE